MSAFLHQIFYANNKFGYVPDSGLPDDKYTFIEDLAKWSIPKPIYITKNAYNEVRGVQEFAVEELSSKANAQLAQETPMKHPVSRSIKTLEHVTHPGQGIIEKTNVNPRSPLADAKRPEFLPTRHPVHHKIPSNLSIFQSIFLIHYGYSEYIMAGNRMLNRELEEKQKIMETLSKTPKKLKEGNHKLTNDNIQEILSGLLVATKEEIMHLVAYSTYYNRIIYLVFTHSYLVFSPTKEVSVDSTNIESVYILNQTRKHPKYGGSYYPDLDPTLEKLANIHNRKIHLEHYAKPFKGVSAYKLPELEEMATKIGVFEKDGSIKYKKKELYDKITEVCCAGICA